MGDYVGGCIFFEPNQSRKTLIASTLQAMELVPDTLRVGLPESDTPPQGDEEWYPVRTEPTFELSLAVLAHIGVGCIESIKPGPQEMFWFEPKVGPYPAMTVWVTDMAMFYDDLPEYNEAFVQRWLHLCEQGNAIFGYFSSYLHMYERSELEENVLPAVESGDLTQLLEKSADVYWLAYLNPELAQRWRQQQTPLPDNVHPIISQELLSGAHFLRISRSAYGD